MQVIDAGDAPATIEDAPVTPQSFIAAMTLLLVCQLAGETLVRSLGMALPHFAFPGPVAGMVILFGLLAWRGRIGPSVTVASDGILRNLSLLFVPAAVGVVQYGHVIAKFGLALITALVVSTVATLIVTVTVFVVVARHTDTGDEHGA